MNHVGDCLKWLKKFSELLAVAEVPVFVLEIHGEMDKNEKIPLRGYSPTPLISLG